MEKLTLNQKLKFEFVNLKFDGSNIDEFFNYRYDQYKFEFSEMPKEAKIRAAIKGKLFGKSKIFINKVLSERTFIQDQLVSCKSFLKEPIHLDAREKLNIWVDYLKQKDKAIGEIKLKVPDWSQPLIALYMKYKGIDYNENNVNDICDQLGYKGKISELKDKYYEFREVKNRTYQNIDLKSEKAKADAQLIRLNDLKLIMEDRSEKESEAYEQLLSEIKELNKNLGYL